MIDSDTFFKDKKILIVGLGLTGISASSMLIRLGGRVVAVDNNINLNRDDLYNRISKNSINRGVKVPEGCLEVIIDGDANDNISLLEDTGLIIASPGIPGNISLFKAARENGTGIWDELELVWSIMGKRQKKNTIAVTGTNGKTTVVNLMQKIFADSGLPCLACGNVGLPLIDTLQLSRDLQIIDDETIRVIEVSSFQLERTETFKPHIGVILNITSDHMDRHGNLRDYGRIKFNLFSNQNREDIAVLNMDDPFIANEVCNLRRAIDHPLIIEFGLKSSREHNFQYSGDNIFFDFVGYKGDINIKGVQLRGMHNISNIMASMIPALLNGVPPGSIERSIKDFESLDHRIEYLGEVAGIRCFNDSKSTNPDSTAVALQDFRKEVTLIMGGKDKDMDFLILAGTIDSKVNNLILIGQAASRIKGLLEPLEGDYRIHLCGSLEEAVELSFKITKPGEVLLLSPACASMDMFIDYKDRGERFKKMVLSYEKK